MSGLLRNCTKGGQGFLGCINSLEFFVDVCRTSFVQEIQIFFAGLQNLFDSNEY